MTCKGIIAAACRGSVRLVRLLGPSGTATVPLCERCEAVARSLGMGVEA